ncbi:MAG: hypothetical protein PHQ80_02220 [Candidatus ainarchaeum sp.]|nr:hypothetical protein [Candidatus ainarchaeum sp.]MDD5096497.1 hypothetical protein [Candidatus ainarchaeum sp.]
MKAVPMALIFVSAAFAACSLDSSQFSEAMPIIGAAIMLSVAVVAVAYAAGSMLRDAHLLVFSKDELFHLLISVLLVVAIQSIFTGSCLITSDVLDGNDPLTYSVSYMRGLRIEGSSVLTGLMRSSIDQKYAAAETGGYFFPFVGGEIFMEESFKNAYSRHLDIAFDFVMMGFVSSGLQYEGMKMVGFVSLGVLLPFGLILRMLPKLRDSGNVVIALAFAIYIFIPFSYAAIGSVARDMPVGCDYKYDGGDDPVFGPCDGVTGFGTIANYIMQTIFLPNLALVVFATAAGALVKIAKVIP